MLPSQDREGIHNGSACSVRILHSAATCGKEAGYQRSRERGCLGNTHLCLATWRPLASLLQSHEQPSQCTVV